MAVRLFSSSVSTILNTANKTKTQRCIIGMIIGAAPFLFIVFCWIFISVCLNSLIRFYYYMKNRHHDARRNNIDKTTTQIDAV
jgi:hypothetical protein